MELTNTCARTTVRTYSAHITHTFVPAGTIYYSVGLTHVVYAMIAVLTLSGVQEDLPKDKRELVAMLKTYYSLLQQGGYMDAATYR